MICNTPLRHDLQSYVLLCPKTNPLHLLVFVNLYSNDSVVAFSFRGVRGLRGLKMVSTVVKELVSINVHV